MRRGAKLLALAATAGLALACNREVRYPELDQSVKARLAKEPALASANLKVRSEGTHVFLTGRVRTPAQRTIAGEVADDVYGVTLVTNDIQVDVAAPPPAASQAPPPTPAPEEYPPNTAPDEAPDGAPENSQ